MRNIKKRVGNFITIIGFSMIALFFISDLSGSPNYYLLIAGIFGFWWGVKTIRKAYSAPQKANRYRLIKRTFSRGKNSEDENDQFDLE